MYIKKAEKPAENHIEEFIALDDTGMRLGRASLSERVNELEMPHRPYEITVEVSGHNEARPQLVAAATVSAMMRVRGQNPPVPSRILAVCGPRNRVLLELLKSIGYQSDDALVRMHRGDLTGGSTAHPPQGTLLIRDALDDEAERRFFLERCRTLRGMADAEGWLREKAALPLFQRFLLAGHDGLAAEAVFWAEPDSDRGVAGLIYTAPAWRRRGAALCLMESMRVYAAQQGLQEIVCDVRQRNVPATQLSYSAGYRPAETLALLPGINL